MKTITITAAAATPAIETQFADDTGFSVEAIEGTQVIHHVLWYYRFPVQTSFVVLFLLEDKVMLSDSLPFL